MMTLLLGLAKSAFAEEEPGTVLDLSKKKWGGRESKWESCSKFLQKYMAERKEVGGSRP